jgi:hypothetical protein
MHYRVNDTVAVRHPVTGNMLVPPAATEYHADDPLVVEYPWLFNQVHRHDELEDASAVPGHRRAPRKAAAKKTAARKATKKAAASK